MSVPRNPGVRNLGVLALALGLGGPFGVLGCSRLPDYAAPKSEMSRLEDFDFSDVTPYRPLARDDFKGTNPPVQFAANAKDLGAVTCASVVPYPPATLSIRYVTKGYETTYTVMLDKPPSFVALMDRRCSWWNPRGTNPAAYQMQHEQIHFALVEISARRLNAAAPEIQARSAISSSSKDDAVARVNELVNDAVQDEVESLIARNGSFDEDTSGVYEPVKQKDWLDQVEKELNELSAHLYRGPIPGSEEPAN